jgi:cell division protein FtsI/penicillin-binding protein 2
MRSTQSPGPDAPYVGRRAERRARDGGGRRTPIVLVVVLALALAAGAGAFVLLRPKPARDVAAAWLADWQRGDYPAMQKLLAQPANDLAGTYATATRGLGVASAAYQLGSVPEDGGKATAPFTATLQLRGVGRWSYQGSLALTKKGRDWHVAWTPAAIHPRLTAGTRLSAERVWPDRAPILAADGSPLVSTSEVVVVGVQKNRIKDRAAVLKALERDAGADPAAVAEQLDDPKVKPDWFIPVAELPKARYETVKDRLFPVPGTVFKQTFGRVVAEGAPAQVIGQVREATAEDLKRLGAGYAAGDRVGVSGLERSRETQLAGRPEGRISLVPVKPAQGGTPSETVLDQLPGKNPVPVRTTIDRGTQAAAARALDGVGKPAVLVALQASTGEVRAVVNSPSGDGFNRAFSGRYPPGSTFKVITSTALLTQGVKPSDVVDCPETTVVDGRRFQNFEGEKFGKVSFSEVFAESCNTAFIQLADSKLPDGALAKAAGQFGFNVDYPEEPSAAEPRFPEPGSETAKAASAIGQAQVAVSPLHMATVAGAVASGSWRPPRLLDGAKTNVAPRKLDPGVVADLRSLMTGVVQRGSGTAAAVPGRQVAGKTGTAEFGSGNPPKTHAWFIGYSGDLAFAVLVEGGGVGGRVAAPLASKFLTGLGG